jgi:hypothetical protein
MDPNVTVYNSAAAAGGSGNLTYQWRRTGTSSATLTGSNAAYVLNSDAANYAAAGEYNINRYAKDATCNTAWVAASGVYTLTVVRVGPPGDAPTTLCLGCCYNGSSWVSCYVTTNAYPFDSSSSNTQVIWSGNTAYYPGATFSKDGRRNSAAIPSTGESAVQICKNLGSGWYLPAYDELKQMAGRPWFVSWPTSGHRSFWSSTERYDNDGQYSTIATPTYQLYTVAIDYNGSPGSCHKNVLCAYVRCAWRN